MSRIFSIFIAIILGSALLFPTRQAMAAPPSPGCLGFVSPVTNLFFAFFTAAGPFYAGETLTIDVTTTTTVALLVGGVTVIPATPTPATLTYTLVANATNFQFNAGMNINATITCTPAPGATTASGEPFQSGITRATDDRLDRRWGMPLATYCRNDGFHVYLIDDNSKGILRLIVTPEQIEAVPETPAQNTLVARSQENIRLYRLASGEFQVQYGPNANGDEYGWAWTTCTPDEGTDRSFNLYQ